MKILLATPSYYPNIGGVEYVVKSIVERLAALGHETTVVTADPKADRPREEEINGVKVVRWPTWAPSGAYHIPKERGQLRSLLEKLLSDVDAVHVHSAHAVLTVWAAAAARRISPGMRIVFTPHYHGTGHSALRRLLWIPWRRYVVHAVETAKPNAQQTRHPRGDTHSPLATFLHGRKTAEGLHRTGTLRTYRPKRPGARAPPRTGYTCSTTFT